MQAITDLTPNQLTFVDWITRGLSVEEAAKEIELRWAVIMEWKRTIPAFRLAFEEALECRAMLIRERAHQLVFEALDVLLNLLRDPKSSPSIRLRASLTLIKMSAAPVAKRKLENMHKNAQGQTVRLPVEPGRNSVCRCGSGLKFKRCCGNPVPVSAKDQATEEATAA